MEGWGLRYVGFGQFWALRSEAASVGTPWG